ncbi:hypothetical protein AB0F73_10675 [Micromonospora purpureochromogenes]|uniref:hypothetical protein n=1 Tax=Micromonospora purpureochromogenes TaxID=47872 RepID=UPI0033DA1C47
MIAQYREAVVGSAMGIGIEFANYSLFDHSPAGSQLALTVAIVGVLLALLRSALQLFVQDALEPVEKLAEIVDLQADSNVALVEGLLQRYLSVTEIEFRPVKEQIIADATEQLRRLAVEKRSSTLQTTDYYEWLFTQFDALRPGEYVRAVSLSSDTEWNDSQLERNFLAKNLEAANRGAQVSRIFVVEDERLADFLKLPPIAAHTTEIDNGLMGYFVSRNYLQRADRDALAEIGEGFIDFNGHVALEDRFDPNGKARGDVTMLRSDLDKMRRIYQRLLNMAMPLSGVALGAEHRA